MNLQHILAASDDSEAGRQAVRCAIDLALPFDPACRARIPSRNSVRAAGHRAVGPDLRVVLLYWAIRSTFRCPKKLMKRPPHLRKMSAARSFRSSVGARAAITLRFSRSACS
jgi:nucleotide-binding universal stress UspA family protein